MGRWIGILYYRGLVRLMTHSTTLSGSLSLSYSLSLTLSCASVRTGVMPASDARTCVCVEQEREWRAFQCARFSRPQPLENEILSNDESPT